MSDKDKPANLTKITNKLTMYLQLVRRGFRPKLTSKCVPVFSYNTYVGINIYGEIIYGGHYRCCAELQLKKSGGGYLQIWVSGVMKEKVYINGDRK
jgi:hypothetical protein